MIDGVIALYIFMLAAFTGYEVISRVPVILHTPLMSGSNFVHGIVLVGAMVALAAADTTLLRVIGVIGYDQLPSDFGHADSNGLYVSHSSMCVWLTVSEVMADASCREEGRVATGPVSTRFPAAGVPRM